MLLRCCAGFGLAGLAFPSNNTARTILRRRIDRWDAISSTPGVADLPSADSGTGKAGHGTRLLCFFKGFAGPESPLNSYWENGVDYLGD